MKIAAVALAVLLAAAPLGAADPPGFAKWTAAELARRGHRVTLLTSHPETAAGSDVRVAVYRTFDELRDSMQSLIAGAAYDCVIHCAAVSDYTSGGIFAVRFDQ